MVSTGEKSHIPTETSTSDYPMPTPCILPFMHPVSLQFTEDELELQFLSAYARVRISNHDKISVVLGLCSVFATGSAMFVHGFDLIHTCSILILLTYAAATLHLTVARKSSFRTMCVLLFRAVNSVVTALNLRRRARSTTPRGGTVLFKHVSSTNGVLNMIWEPFLFPLPLRYNLASQAFSSLTYSCALTDLSCKTTVSNETGCTVVQQAWQYIYKVCYNSMFFGRIQVLDLPALKFIGTQPHLACAACTLLVQMVCGYVLPLAVLYCMERRERVLFWAKKRSCSQRAASLAMKVTLLNKVLVMLVLCFSVLSVWEAAVVLLYNHLLP